MKNQPGITVSFWHRVHVTRVNSLKKWNKMNEQHTYIWETWIIQSNHIIVGGKKSSCLTVRNTGGRHFCFGSGTRRTPTARWHTLTPPPRSWPSPATHYLSRDWGTAPASGPFSVHVYAECCLHPDTRTLCVMASQGRWDACFPAPKRF